MSNASTSSKLDLKDATKDYHELVQQVGREIHKIDLLLRAYYKKYPAAQEQILTKWNLLKEGKSNAVEVFFRKPHQFPANIATHNGVLPEEAMITKDLPATEIATPNETETGDDGSTTIDTYSLVGAPPAGPVPQGPK